METDYVPRDLRMIVSEHIADFIATREELKKLVPWLKPNFHQSDETPKFGRAASKKLVELAFYFEEPITEREEMLKLLDVDDKYAFQRKLSAIHSKKKTRQDIWEIINDLSRTDSLNTQEHYMEGFNYKGSAEIHNPNYQQDFFQGLQIMIKNAEMGYLTSYLGILYPDNIKMEEQLNILDLLSRTDNIDSARRKLIRDKFAWVKMKNDIWKYNKYL
jgi:hypothetical protein